MNNNTHPTLRMYVDCNNPKSCPRIDTQLAIKLEYGSQSESQKMQHWLELKINEQGKPKVWGPKARNLELL